MLYSRYRKSDYFQPYRITAKRIYMKNSKTSNKRGRRAAEGSVHKYVVPDDVHDWIRQHGGSRYVTDTFRAIKAATLKAQENPSL